MKSFVAQNQGQYDNLYVQGHTLLLADIYGSFRNKCLEIFSVDLPNPKQEFPTDTDSRKWQKNVSEVDFVMLYTDMQKQATNM